MGKERLFLKKSVDFSREIIYNLLKYDSNAKGGDEVPKFTKQAIKNAFLKQLNEKPLSKISVRTIVEECGINRNSFYYHFQDIPSLIEEIVTDAADTLIQKYPSINTLEEAADAAFHFTLKNKKAVLHICNSVNRNIYERYLMKICGYVVTTYVETAFKTEKNNIDENDKEIMIHFTKCTLFGLFIDWINSGMKDDAIDRLKRLITICHGLSDEMLERCRK